MSSPAARTSHLRTPPLSRAFSSDGALASAAATTPLPASTAYRVLLLAIAGSHVFLAAGVVFGWASLAQILAGQGVGCDGDDCSGQPGVFAFVFTLGTVGSYTSNLPFGYLLDTRGPRFTCVVGSLVQLSGALCMYAATGGSMQLLYVGFFLIGFGGPGIQMATFHMANLFPSMSGTLMAGSTSLFDAGTAIFAGFRAVSATVDLSTCWLWYSASVLFILLSGLVLWPSAPFAEVETASTAGGGAAKATLREYVCKRQYVYLLLFASIHIMRLNYVVGVFQQQVGSLGFDAAAVDDFVTIFGALLPFGFVGMPLIGYLLDNTPPTVSFALVNAAGVINSVLFIVPNSRPCLLGAMCCVAIGRQFVYSTFFEMLQRFSSPSVFGMLAGIANMCVAATGVMQPSLVSMSTDTFADWGLYSFAPVNLLMIGLVLFLSTQPLPCWQDKAGRASFERAPTTTASVAPLKTALLKDEHKEGTLLSPDSQTPREGWMH